jgi:UDPglucose 6-dehydrogenase
LTEWKQFKSLDPHATGELVKARKMVDGRLCLDPAEWRDAGWTYRAPGRPE